MNWALPGWPFVTLGVLLVSGCSRQPAAITAPAIDPEEAASQALRLYDSDASGAIEGHEFANCPSLAYALDHGADSNGDRKLTTDEIAARIRQWTSGGVNMAYVPLILSYKGRPLPNAFVTLTPEDFLGDGFLVARGITDSAGQANVSHLDDDLPKQNRGLGAIYCGYYRMQVQHPQIKLPDAYTSGDGLGIEVFGDYRMSGLVYPLDGQ